MFEMTSRDARDLQSAIQTMGQAVGYLEAGNPVARTVKARVRYLNAVELENSIEAYPCEVTLDARDFAARPPAKGDAIVIDGSRRGVMQVRPRMGSGRLVAYACGVQG